MTSAHDYCGEALEARAASVRSFVYCRRPIRSRSRRWATFSDPLPGAYTIACKHRWRFADNRFSRWGRSRYRVTPTANPRPDKSSRYRAFFSRSHQPASGKRPAIPRRFGRSKSARPHCAKVTTGICADYQKSKLACDAAQKQIVNKGKGDRIAIKRALDQLGPPPAPPLTPILTCPEPTYQGLVKRLAGGQPSIGIFAGEGGQFIGGYGMNDDNKLATAGGLSDAWDGVPIKRVRSGDGVTILPGRRVAMHLLAQPDVAAMMLADRLLLSQGLLSRILVTAPESLAGTRMWREPSEDSDRAIKRYGARILDILERPLPLVDGKTNELAPRCLPLTADARKIWIEFADNIEAQIKDDGVFAPIRGLANKLPEHAQRLGSVTALVADIEAGALSADDLARGIMLAQHYAAEALRLFEASQVSGDLMLAQRLLIWLTSAWSGTAVSLPDVYQHGPSAIRNKTMAGRIVGILEDHGWLSKIEGGAEVAGHQRRDAWHIIRKLT